jgi:hypothetical protein
MPFGLTLQVLNTVGLVTIINNDENDPQKVRKGYTCHKNVLSKITVGALILKGIPNFVNGSRIHIRRMI